MKFLIDNQLPPKLAQWLTEQGHEGVHLQEVGLADAQDIAVLNFTAKNGMVLVSKDEDFLHLVLAQPKPSQVVWVRLGNCRTTALLSAFRRALPSITDAITAGQSVVELR